MKNKKLHSPLKKIWLAYGFFAVVVGSIAMSVLWPKIEVEPTGTLDASQLFGTTIDIENSRTLLTIQNRSTLLSLYNVHLYGTVYNLEFQSGESIDNVTVNGDNTTLGKLEAGRGNLVAFNLSNAFSSSKEVHSEIKYAEVIFKIKYKYLGLKHERIFYYRTLTDADGYATWYEIDESMIKQKRR